MKNNKLRAYFYALRINQWIKNFVIFTAIIFSGQLFNWQLLLKSFSAFFIFCLLSSTSYVLNDIIDYPYDREHPIKKFRPIASGDL
jgi:4-hydroxybenzoate polyprenyltransferase